VVLVSQEILTNNLLQQKYPNSNQKSRGASGLMSIKMKILVISLITVLCVSIAGWFVTNSDLQQQITELQEQNRDLQEENDELLEQLDLLQKRLDFNASVLITKFSSIYGWSNVVGMTIAMNFNVSVQNFGISDIEGLIVEVKRYGFGEDPSNQTIKLDVLYAGETIEFLSSFVLGWDSYFDNFHGQALTATLKLGEAILDVKHFMPDQYP
jgi:cell division protein FtsB